MNYQDLVARAIAVKAADLEIGLSRAREQRPFIESISRVLDKTQFVYAVRMDRDFRTTFNIEIDEGGFKHLYQAAKQALSVYFDVEFSVSAAQPVLAVHSREPQGFSCRVIFGDVPF